MSGGGISRRAFLAGSCSAFALMPSAQAARLGALHDETIWEGLVNAIAGPVETSPVLRAALRSDFVGKFGLPALHDMVEQFGREGVASVRDPQPEEIEEQVRWIALYLFTGSADPSDANAPMINYPYALSWKSLSFAKAPGLCSGPEFGYWHQAWTPA